MSAIIAVYDACVLYPAPLRSFLMYLALTDLFHAKWTEPIHEEWMRSVQKDYPDISRAKTKCTLDLLNNHVRDCLITGFEDLIEALTLPDPDDRQVLAATIRSGADVIVTFNLSDFPSDKLAKYGIVAQHPDEFIMHFFDLAPAMVCSAASKQREGLRNPPLSTEQFPSRPVNRTPRVKPCRPYWLLRRSIAPWL